MNVLPFIPKDDQALPDCWGIKIFYVDGRAESFEGIHCMPIKEGLFEFRTHEGDLVNYVVLSSVKRIEFDSRFSKVIEISKRKMAEETDRDPKS